MLHTLTRPWSNGLWFLWRVLWALLILIAFLGSGPGCGAVTVDQEGDASVIAGDVPGRDSGVAPDIAAATDLGPQGDADAYQETERPSIPDAGVSLPVCPPEIMAYDCPQPKCDCRDR